MSRLPTKADTALGSWMSAALDCPNTCDEMKAAVREWFDSFNWTHVDWTVIAMSKEHLKCVITITGQKDSNETSIAWDFDPSIRPDESNWGNSGALLAARAFMKTWGELGDDQPQVDYCDECDTSDGHMGHCSRAQYQR